MTPTEQTPLLEAIRYALANTYTPEEWRGQGKPAMACLVQRVPELIACVEDLETDAKRYRALRDCGRYAVDPIGEGWCFGRDEHPAALDAAADRLAAR